MDCTCNSDSICGCGQNLFLIEILAMENAITEASLYACISKNALLQAINEKLTSINEKMQYISINCCVIE